jgi:hypothetical protein
VEMVTLAVEQMGAQEAAKLLGAGTAGTVPLILEANAEKYVERVLILVAHTIVTMGT